MPAPTQEFGSGYFVQGYVTVGLWAKVAGAWQLVTTRQVFIYQQVNSGGVQQVTWQVFDTVDLPAGVQAFGTTVQDHNGTACAVTDLASVSWTAQQTSGERSATPGGQASTVVISPQ